MSFLKTLDMKNVPGGWLGVLSACASIFVSHRLCLFYTKKLRLAKTKSRIKARQEQRRKNVDSLQEKINQENGSFEPTIPSLEFRELQKRLQSGQLSCREVLLAFQNKALEVHDQLNCVTEFLEEAEARAVQLDQLPPEQRGPLHGIPLSLKEAVVLKGHDSTAGLSNLIGQNFEDDSVILKVMLMQGAVPFARTNLSQGQMSINCSNPIFGNTLNPHNQSRTSGGSSGGEGAMIGAGASVLGICCDMGGSIRVPASFCGVAGFKCSDQRTSYVGNIPCGHGIKTLNEVYSPMARDVDTLVDFMRAVLVPSLYQLDRFLPTMPWNETLYSSTKPLKIGFYIWDGGVEPVPAVERAVHLAKSKLEARGFVVEEFHPPDVPYMFSQLFLKVLDGDGGKLGMEFLKDDLVDPCIKDLHANWEMPLPLFVRKLLSMIIPKLHPLTKDMILLERCKDVAEWWSFNEEIDEYKRNFVHQMDSQGLDCLICPTLPHPAWQNYQTESFFESITYTCLYNLLMFPAGVVPTTAVTVDDVAKMKDYPTRTNYHTLIHDVMKDSEGLPIGVQCVGLPYQEETVLRLMKELETALREH